MYIYIYYMYVYIHVYIYILCLYIYTHRDISIAGYLLGYFIMESQRSAEMTNDLGVSEGLIYCSESLGGNNLFSGFMIGFRFQV